MFTMEACTMRMTVKLPQYMSERDFAGCNLNPVVVLKDCRKLLKGMTPETHSTSLARSQESRNGSISSGRDSQNGFSDSEEIKNDGSTTTSTIRSSPSCGKSVKRKRDSSDLPEYEIEKIVGYHIDKRGKIWYLIKWKGWSHKYNTYEPIDNLTGCHYKLMKFFEAEIPSADALTKKNSELLEAVKKRSLYEKLVSDTCIPEDLEELRDEFPTDFPRVFRSKDMKNLHVKIEDEYHCIIRCLIGMECHQDPGLFYRAQTYKLFLMLIQKRQRQLKSLKAVEKAINKIEKIPIEIRNQLDFEEFPTLNYITEWKPGDGVVVPTEPLLGCECDECSPTSLCCGKMADSEFAYCPEGKLRTNMRIAIYECNSRCRCPETCRNRVVQRGRQFKLCIFKTKSCGWGVRAEESIPKGSFVCEYVGELIPDSEANVRDVEYFKDGKAGYMFDLDFFTVNCLKMYCMDATNYGNVARFINHSCNPNLIVYPVWVESLAPNVHRLAFFARRRIRKGEEIHFDYENLENFSDEQCDENVTGYFMRMFSNVRCQCNSSNCRKWVFGNK